LTFFLHLPLVSPPTASLDFFEEGPPTQAVPFNELASNRNTPSSVFHLRLSSSRFVYFCNLPLCRLGELYLFGFLEVPDDEQVFFSDPSSAYLVGPRSSLALASFLGRALLVFVVLIAPACRGRTCPPTLVVSYWRLCFSPWSFGPTSFPLSLAPFFLVV